MWQIIIHEATHRNIMSDECVRPVPAEEIVIHIITETNERLYAINSNIKMRICIRRTEEKNHKWRRRKVPLCTMSAATIATTDRENLISYQIRIYNIIVRPVSWYISIKHICASLWARLLSSPTLLAMVAPSFMHIQSQHINATKHSH